MQNIPARDQRVPEYGVSEIRAGIDSGDDAVAGGQVMGIIHVDDVGCGLIHVGGGYI